MSGGKEESSASRKVGAIKKEISGRLKTSGQELLREQEERLRRELDEIKQKWLKKHEDDISFFKEALFNHYNIITVGGLTLLGLAAGPFLPLGLAAAAAFEVLWLGLAPGNPRFRRMIRAEKNRELLNETEVKRQEQLDSLPLELQDRHQLANQIIEEIRKQAEAAESGELEFLFETLAKLDFLLEQYRRMLVSYHRTGEILKTSEAKEIDAKIDEIQAGLPNSSGKVKAAKQKHLTILEQRKERFEKTLEEREYLRVSLETLESTLKLVRDRVVVATSVEGISSSLDDLVLETSRHRDFMEAVEEELHGGESQQLAPDISAPPAPPEEELPPLGERERV